MHVKRLTLGGLEVDDIAVVLEHVDLLNAGHRLCSAYMRTSQSGLTCPA